MSFEKSKTPEKDLPSTAERISQLAADISAEAEAAQLHNTHVTNGPRAKFRRAFRFVGFKQDVELPLSPDEKRLVVAASALRALTNVLPVERNENNGLVDGPPERKAEEPVVIGHMQGDFMIVTEADGIATVVSNIQGERHTHTINRRGVVFHNATHLSGAQHPEPVHTASQLFADMAHFTQPAPALRFT